MVELVKEKSRVILHTGESSRIFFHVIKGASFRAGKGRVLCDPMIGAPFGAVFEVRHGILERIEKYAEDTYEDDHASEPDIDEHNQELVDTNTAQALSTADIEDLKSKLSGEDLVQILAKHSSTFNEKTAYSQQKYLKRKRKKYITHVKLVKPTAFSIAEAYFTKKPEKVLWMRPDTLAMILSRANLRPFSQCLVFDTVCSVVSGAIAERLHGNGRVLVGFPGPSPSTDSITTFDFSPVVAESIVHFPMTFIRDIASGDEQAKVWLREGSDSLVIVSEYDPVETFKGMFPFLVNAGFFVVYCYGLEPLSELMLELKQSRTAVSVQLTENWFREQQILPGRTHPVMNTSGGGGYLLSGIKAIPSHPPCE